MLTTTLALKIMQYLALHRKTTKFPGSWC